jgi:hypothetical protein
MSVGWLGILPPYLHRDSILLVMVSNVLFFVDKFDLIFFPHIIIGEVNNR